MPYFYRLLTLTTITALVITGFTGCSGSNDEPPTIPEADSVATSPPENRANSSTTSRQWGTWVIHCVDATGDQPASVEAAPLRAGQIHLAVTDMLLPPTCTNCFDIELMGIIDLDWTFQVELTNPTVLTGYDVKGIFPSVEGPSILQPDGYTDMYGVDGSSETHHPFVIFDTGNADREWGPGESHGQMFTFHKEPDEKYADLVYVVAASWPGHQEEVAELKNPSSTGPLYTDASNPATLTVDVIDWQDNIEYVLINLQPVNGSAYTHMQPIGEGDTWQFYNYAEYGLSPGTEELLIAAKSEGSDYLTYTYLTINIIDPPPPPTYFQVLSGPTELDGIAAPTGEMDLAVVGIPGGESATLVYSSSTTIHAWNEDYSLFDLFLTLVEPGGGDPLFPVDPISRIAVTDPADPDSMGSYSFVQINEDLDPWDDTTDPDILYRNVIQLVDIDQSLMVDFKVTADNIETPELDAILRPVDVSCGVGDDRNAYALWVPDEGAFPGYYPYVTLVRYEPPYKDLDLEYDTLIGGVLEGSGDGRIDADDVTGLAVWDGEGEGNLVIAVSEGGSSNVVEIFNADYITNPAGEFTPVSTITGFVGTPLDVAILPVADAGFEDENWICILTQAGTIEIHTFSGDFVESVYYPEEIPNDVTHIDTDIENMRIHIFMAGPTATVVEYTGI